MAAASASSVELASRSLGDRRPTRRVQGAGQVAARQLEFQRAARQAGSPVSRARPTMVVAAVPYMPRWAAISDASTL